MIDPKEKKEYSEQESENLDRARRRLLRMTLYVPPAILVLPLIPPQSQNVQPIRTRIDIFPEVKVNVSVE